MPRVGIRAAGSGIGLEVIGTIGIGLSFLSPIGFETNRASPVRAKKIGPGRAGRRECLPLVHAC